MIRIDNFTLRVSTDERQLIAAVAQRLDRNESDTVRHLLREKARELGIAPSVVQSAPCGSDRRDSALVALRE